LYCHQPYVTWVIYGGTPLSISRSDAKLDVIVGVNTHGGEVQPIGMTSEQRQKHTYVIGKTGMGKTTLLSSSIYQDMVNGKGLAVLDPYGDTFQELLSVVPEHRRQDVVVFDP
jgi:ABC-type branched-subunit amino acid transport system ATPase component